MGKSFEEFDMPIHYSLPKFLLTVRFQELDPLLEIFFGLVKIKELRAAQCHTMKFDYALECELSSFLVIL